jgi:hypothetical protein
LVLAALIMRIPIAPDYAARASLAAAQIRADDPFDHVRLSTHLPTVGIGAVLVARSGASRQVVIPL